MLIELPSKPDTLDERLASLEDPFLAERLMHENPALFAQELPQTQREILAWTTRRFGTALLAVTAAVSIAAGYFVYDFSRGHAAAPSAAHPAAAAALPLRHAPPVARHRTPHVLPSHASAPVAHTASAPVAHLASAPVVVYHTAPLPAAHAAPAHAVALSHATVRTHEAQAAPQRAPAAAPQTAAAQLAAWEAAHSARHAGASTATAAEPAPRTRPRSEPATATETATTTASSTEPATTTPTAGGAPDPGSGGGVKTPPTNPGGIWNERIPGGGTLGGAIGPIIGVPRDSCTPRGGRVGIVMQAISVLTSSRH
jgi:hypothetical protein